MKQKKKNILGKLVPVCLILALIGTGAYLYHTKDQQIGEDITISNNGINLRLLTQGTNDLGETTYTFSYVIAPDNATNQSVTISLTYKDDGTNILDNEVSSSLDESAKIVTLTCHKAFNRMILFKIISNKNPSAYAEVDLQYEKKLLSFKYKYNVFSIGGQSSHNNLPDFKASSFITPTYSIYTKDKNYTFAPKSFALTIEEIHINKSTNFTMDFYNKVLNLIEKKIKNQESAVTAEEIWNLDSSNSIHSSLEYISSFNYKDAYIFFACQEAEFYCIEHPEITYSDPQSLNIYMYFDFDYSNFIINTESVTLDFLEIIF